MTAVHLPRIGPARMVAGRRHAAGRGMCCTNQRCAKFRGALFRKPFAQAIRREFSGSNHRQHFGDCFGLPIPARWIIL